MAQALESTYSVTHLP